MPASEFEDSVLKKYLFPIENSVQKLVGTEIELPEINFGGDPDGADALK